MEVVGDAGTLWNRHMRDSSLTEAVLDLLCLHHLPDEKETCSVSLALLSPWLCPPFGPIPAHPSSLSPTIASSYFGPLHLSSPRSLVLHVWLQQPQPHWASWCHRAAPLVLAVLLLSAGIQQDEHTNKQATPPTQLCSKRK